MSQEAPRRVSQADQFATTSGSLSEPNAALPHSEIRPLTGTVFLVEGRTPLPKGMYFQRSMTIFRDPGTGDVTLFNPIRLEEPSLSALARIGPVRHVVRLAGMHGRDDAFYVGRFPDAVLWLMAGSAAPEGVPPDRCRELRDSMGTAGEDAGEGGVAAPPAALANVFVFSPRIARHPDGAALLPGAPRVLVVGDAVQNYPTFFSANASYLTSVFMYFMGAFCLPACDLGAPTRPPST